LALLRREDRFCGAPVTGSPWSGDASSPAWRQAWSWPASRQETCSSKLTGARPPGCCRANC